MAQATLTAAQQAANARNLNIAAANMVRAVGVRMQQPIYSQTFADNTSTPVVTIQPRNVGLILGFYVKVSCTITNNDADNALAQTAFGPANLVSRFSFTDFENNERISTPGWHLACVDSIKARRPFGSALVNATGVSSIIAFGANYTVNSGGAVAKGGGTATYAYTYWVPLAYSEDDFRGAIYANVTNANLQLALSLNQTPFKADANGNTLGYVATGTTSAAISALKIEVDQVYLDQLPRGQNGGVVLPMLDLATIYELKQTQYNGVTASEDFPMDYPNFRDFIATVAAYYNGATAAPGYAAGTDVNYWALQSANFTNIWKMRPDLAALRTRNHLGCDMPTGLYYFGSRKKPISTVQYGNQQLVLNPKTVTTTAAQVYLAYESFGFKNVISGAGSIKA